MSDWRRLTDPTPCRVAVDGRTLPGFVLAWRRRDDGWHAYVRWTAGIGAVHLGWFAGSAVLPGHDGDPAART